MGEAALAFCLALGIPAETPRYDYSERQAEINICVGQALRAWDTSPTKHNSENLRLVLEVQAACLAYCPSKWDIPY